jgi:hypothetical protein
MGSIIAAIGLLGVLDGLFRPAPFHGDTKAAVWGFLLVLAIPGLSLILLMRSSNARRQSPMESYW